MAYITLEKLERFGVKLSEKISALFVQKESGKGLSQNDYTDMEKNKLSGLENYTHPNSGVTAGIYRQVTVDGNGHVTTGANPTTLAGYGIEDAALKAHTHGNNDITGMDASKITSGKIDLDRLPAGALDKLVTVTNDTARFALTKSTVQIGDTVKVNETGKLYLIVDDAKLSTEDGYEPYNTGSAASVPWSGVTGKPTTFTPSVHKHTLSQITDYTEATDTDIDNIISGLFTS